MYDDHSLEILDYHRLMLLDEVRTASFLKAILKTVKPGDIVLDMGCGTGILSYFACIAGARHVYAVEQGPILSTAKKICEHNGFQDRVTFLNEWSHKIDLPEKVDVIITETIGNIAFEEGILGWIVDGKNRFLREGGQIIPKKLELVIVTVESHEYDEYLDVWKGDLYSLDYSPLVKIMTNNLLWAEFSPKQYLSDPLSMISVDLQREQRTKIQNQTSFEIKRKGTLNGLGGWFKAQLAPGIHISNAPPNRTSSWNQVYFPIQECIPVNVGDRFDVEVGFSQNAAEWEWKIARKEDRDASGREQVEFHQQSNKGVL